MLGVKPPCEIIQYQCIGSRLGEMLQCGANRRTGNFGEGSHDRRQAMMLAWLVGVMMSLGTVESAPSFVVHDVKPIPANGSPQRGNTPAAVTMSLAVSRGTGAGVAAASAIRHRQRLH